MKYDVVVIGGGAAGATLAARLSEDPKCSVLLLEAGLDYPNLAHLPEGLIGRFRIKSGVEQEHLWRFPATMNSYRVEPTPVAGGKVMGGGTAVNGALFLRGLPEDFDDWASEGNSEWAYTKVLTSFRAIENDLDFSGDFHGQDGPLPITRTDPEQWTSSHRAFYEACRTLDIPDDPDINSPDSTGIGRYPLNFKDGLRISTAVAFLGPSRHRLNLTIRGGVMVRRILFDHQTAIGVEAESGGETFHVEAREIVVSAGALSSPPLLMRSGIGPEHCLQKHQIDVLQDSPGVGGNLQYHSYAIAKWQLQHEVPDDIQPSHLCLRYTASGSDQRNDMIIQPKEQIKRGNTYLKLHVLLLGAPRSVGTVSLASADAAEYPIIKLNNLEDPFDLARMNEGIRLALKIAQQRPFDDLLGDRSYPSDEDVASDEALDRWLLVKHATAAHFAGTCKMGPASDPMAVVDQHCKVYGVNGLSVVDASIMPKVVRGGTAATSIMIGEHAARFVKERVV